MKLQELKHRFNKKYAVRIIAGVLTIALVGTGSTVYGVSTAKAANEKDHSVETVTNAGDEDVLSTLLSGVTVSKKDIAKEETVYLITDANGSVTRTIVSDRLSNKDGKASLEDKSSLKDIVNVKGDEEYTESNGKLTWNANGKEISYQGTTDAATPVSQSVTYFLDGKKIAPEELAGKSGKVTIRFDYKNNSEYTATVNGKSIKTKVPFAAISALVLNDNFKNVEVTNGQMKTADGKSLVIGYALPGMTECLGVDEDQLPEYFEVSADVENFELKTGMTLVVNAANYASTEGVDLSKVDALVNKLTEATDQLADGSSQLTTGLDTLSGSLKEFVGGMQTLNGSKDQLAAGVAQLNEGAQKVSKGAQTLNYGAQQVNSGAQELNKGAVLLNGSAQSLNEGIKLLDNKLKAEMTDEQKADISKEVADTFDKGMRTATIDQIYKSFRYKVVDNKPTDSDLYSLLFVGMKTSYPDLSNEVISAKVEEALKGMAANIVDKAVIPGAQTAAIAAATQTQKEILAGIEAPQANGYSLVTGMAALANGAGTLAEGTGSLIAGTESLANGAGTLAAGTGSLAAGTSQLYGSVPSLTAGITKLTDASLLIQDGVNKLDDGSHKLSDGITQFNAEGIEKLANAYNGDIKAFADKVQAVLDAGEDYQTFTGLADNTNGSVKFIYKLGSVTVK